MTTTARNTRTGTVGTASVGTIGQVRTAAAPNLERLRLHLTGELITSEDPAYDEVRQLHDITVDRRPLAIVRAVDAGDVAEAVRYARQHGLPLAVRSGGHSVAAFSMVDGAIVADLSAMRDVRVDPERRTAIVQGGATSADIVAAAEPHGLALSTGDTSTVGVGGLTTGGGIGWMVRKHGLAIDNLLSAKVVTADGSLVTASADSYPDLFWGIRGGGGNFGIVTEFEFQLADVREFLGGALVLPPTREVIRGYLDYTPTAPDGLTTIAFLMAAPPAPFIPEEKVGELSFVVLTAWAGDLEEGERAIAPLRALGEPIADALGPMPYSTMYVFTEAAAARHAGRIRSFFTNEIGDGDIDNMIEAMRKSTSLMSMVQFRGLGGELARVDSDATAFAHRDKRYLVAAIALWMDATEDADRHEAWLADIWEQLRPLSNGVYVNFLEREGDARTREAYSPSTLERLAEVKRVFDPTNLFRLNQNVPPRK